MQACLASSLTQGVHSRQQCCCHSCPRPCWCAQWKRWCVSREVATGLRQLQGREKRSGHHTNSVFIRITTKFSATKTQLYLDNAFPYILVTSCNGPHTVHKTLTESSGTIHLAFQLPCSLSTYTGPFTQTTFTAKQNNSLQHQWKSLTDALCGHVSQLQRYEWTWWERWLTTKGIAVSFQSLHNASVRFQAALPQLIQVVNHIIVRLHTHTHHHHILTTHTHKLCSIPSISLCITTHQRSEGIWRHFLENMQAILTGIGCKAAVVTSEQKNISPHSLPQKD